MQQFLRSLFFDQLEERLIFFAFSSGAGSCCFQILQRYLKQPDWRGSFYMVYLLLFTILMNSYQQLGVSLKTAGVDDSVYEGLAPAYFVQFQQHRELSRHLYFVGVLLLVGGGMASFTLILPGLICMFFFVW
ncbi:MAG: hypothetical protein ACLRMZ_26855 [Blautia marasmi]